MNFYEIYYLSIIFFAFPVCFLSFKNELTIFKFFNSIIFVYLALLYLYTSLRIEGVDHYAYSRMFVGNEHSHDFGFKFLSFIFYKSQLTYASLLLFIYIINLFSIKKLSEYYNINFFICFLIMLCHVILVRDFSQVRIGFAISIFVFSLGQKNILLRLMIYFLAFSMHFTVIYLIIFYNFCNYLTNFKKYKKFYLVIVGVLLFLIVQNLEIFVFIDDRMGIYLNWDKHGYTRPVVFSNYLILVLHLFVMILGILKKDLVKKDPKIETLIYLQFIGIITFLSFSNLAIFATRLTHVVTAFYFIIVVRVFLGTVDKKNNFSLANFCNILVLTFFCYLLILRPNNFQILSKIKFL